jgi:hypothetical protein
VQDTEQPNSYRSRNVHRMRSIPVVGQFDSSVYVEMVPSSEREWVKFTAGNAEGLRRGQGDR